MNDKRMVEVMARLTVRPYRVEDAAAWKAHLEVSNNATLFHDLDFLAYHGSSRFDFHHLIVQRNSGIVAVIPGAVRPDGVFVSPVGASVGGPAVTKSLRAEEALELVQSLQDYVLGQGWRSIEITMAPPVYCDEPNQLIEFALHVKGFRLVHRSMPLLVPLRSGERDQYRRLFTQSKRSYVRANRHRGVTVRDGDVNALGVFLELFRDTYDRLGGAPTHSPAEIEDLLQRMPDRVQLWIARLDETAIAGVLLFVLNRNVCNTFYICDRVSHRDYRGTTVLFADLIDLLANRGFRYLDLGPSASNGHFNRGVVSFKEELGGEAFCRDRWSWEVRLS